MAYTQTDLDNLERAMASGARRVTIDGVSTEYRDLGEMQQMRNLIRRTLNPPSTAVQPSSRRVARFSKGL